METGTPTSLERLILTLQVHVEAFRLAPITYLTAVKWWLLRKRMRARGQFAPLLGRTSQAYQWWSLQQTAAEDPSPPDTPAIIALVVADPGAPQVAETLTSLKSEGISAHFVGSQGEIDLALACAEIDWSTDPWLLPIGAGDRLAPGAARAYRATLAKSETRVIYADDDLIDDAGRRSSPHFKPGWNAELFLHDDYLTGACVVRAGPDDLVAAAAALARGKDWTNALVREVIAKGSGAVQIRKVLHHRRRRSSPRLPLASVPIVHDLPRLSAIIPTRNRVDLLATCLAGLQSSKYPDIEIIVVDNDSDDPATLSFLEALSSHCSSGRTLRVLRHRGPFNYSAINNRAAAAATGQILCLLNNDIEMLAPDWLEILVSQALRDEVGAVGPQLLYPDGRIQHAGVVIGVGNAAGHAHRFLKPEEQGYFRRHALPQFVSAVTAACLVVQRERFLTVNGLDEKAFPVAFNDVDLCLKLNRRGWQSFYEPRAVLVHHESVSRGFDRDPVGSARFAGELAELQRRWHTDTIYDPFHHPQLSRASEQFALAL